MGAVHEDAVFDFASVANAHFFAEACACADVAVWSNIGFFVDENWTFNVGA